MKRLVLLILIFTFISFPAIACADITFSKKSRLTLPNGSSLPEQDYASVNIKGDRASAEVYFSIDPLTRSEGGPFEPLARFGVKNFGFNTDLDLDSSQIDMPDGWNVKPNRNVSEFGRFSWVLSGTGRSRSDPLIFIISGLAPEDVDISHFDIENTAGNVFSAHIIDFDGSTFGAPQITSSYFAGSGGLAVNSEMPSSLLLPLGLLLFGSIIILRKRLKT